MATWQADFVVLVGPPGLPANYRELVGGFLPPARSWSTDLEVWGIDDGDRIDIPTDGSSELFARFDLREWRPVLYDQFLAFICAVGGRLQAESGVEIPLTAEAFRRSLSESDAARFVTGPRGYLDGLASKPTPLPEEP